MDEGLFVGDGSTYLSALEPKRRPDTGPHSSPDLKPTIDKTHAGSAAGIQPNKRRLLGTRKHSGKCGPNWQNIGFGNVSLKVIVMALKVVNLNLGHFVDFLEGRKSRRILHCSPKAPNVVEVRPPIFTGGSGLYIYPELFKAGGHTGVNRLIQSAIYRIVKPKRSEHKV